MNQVPIPDHEETPERILDEPEDYEAGGFIEDDSDDGDDFEDDSDEED